MPVQSENPQTQSEGTPVRPTNVRLMVIGLGIAMSVLLYLDRFATTPATDAIMRELRLNKTQFGDAVGAFFLAYALMQIPSGWLTDTLGARWMLALYVLCWSLATVGLGLAQGLAAIWTMRLVLGVMQAGAYPTAAGLLKRWVPYSGRGLANSAVSMGGRCGLLLSLLLTIPLMQLFGNWRGATDDNWRYVFILYGSLGIAWSAAFVWLFRDYPAAHPWTNRSEVELISSPLADAPPASDAPRTSGPLLAAFFLALIASILGLIFALAALRDWLSTTQGDSLAKAIGSRAISKALVGAIPQVGGLAGTLALCVLANEVLKRIAPATSRRVGLPFGAMAASKEVWLMCVINILVNIGWVFLATWLPQYLIENHGENMRSTLTATLGWESKSPKALEAAIAALITAVVGIAAILGGLSGGRATDVFVRSYGHAWGRRLPGLCAGVLVCTLYLLVPQTSGVWPFVAIMIAIAFTIDFGLGATWASYQDIGGKNVAAILGVGNMCGNLGAAFFVGLIGQLADDKQWNTVFYLSAAAMLTAACGWLLFNAERPVVRSSGSEAA